MYKASVLINDIGEIMSDLESNIYKIIIPLITIFFSAIINNVINEKGQSVKNQAMKRYDPVFSTTLLSVIGGGYIIAFTSYELLSMLNIIRVTGTLIEYLSITLIVYLVLLISLRIFKVFSNKIRLKQPLFLLETMFWAYANVIGVVFIINGLAEWMTNELSEMSISPLKALSIAWEKGHYLLVVGLLVSASFIIVYFSVIYTYIKRGVIYRLLKPYKFNCKVTVKDNLVINCDDIIIAKKSLTLVKYTPSGMGNQVISIEEVKSYNVEVLSANIM